MARQHSTIFLPVSADTYSQIVTDPLQFRDWIDSCFRDSPELFPQEFAHGYLLKDSRSSKKSGYQLRRIQCKSSGDVFTISPSVLLPYQTGFTSDVQDALFLRSFGVPYWALAKVFGKNRMYWYRLEMSIGRNSIVGTTVRQAELPRHLLADEHHQTCDGDKVYVTTTVGDGCCLGASVSKHADELGLTTAYGVFQTEAFNVDENYRPKTVTTDGWSATKLAWITLFPMIAVIRCFLHGWLAIRKVGKHLKGTFREIGKKVWDAYRSPTRPIQSQRLRRLREWAKRNVSGIVKEQILKLCSRTKEYGVAYDHPGCHRTSNLGDRVMRKMKRYWERGQHLHGGMKAAEMHCRSWALLHNFTEWSPETQKKNGGWRSPAERLNQHRYHDEWLQNLLISSSMGGCRR
jgi:hypothetical protein